MLTESNISRKEQIERQATALFKRKGFSATSMRDLANVLGIEAASIYSHIRSKEEILQKICFRMAKEFFEAINGVEEESPTKQLEQAIIAHINVITNNTGASAVFFYEWRHLSEPSLSEFLEMRCEYEKRFITIIEEGIRSREFAATDKKFAALTLLSSLNWVHHWYMPTGKMSSLEVGQRLAEMLINGLKK